MEQLAKLINDYGLGIGLVIVLCYISYSIIKHILKQGDNLLKLAMEQNEKWQKVVNEHTAQAREFHNISIEAYRHQREENNKIIDRIDKSNDLLIKHEEEVSAAREMLNRSSEQGQREHEKICQCLDDIKEGLVRINGYKH